MRRFVEGEDRSQQALLPASHEDYIDEENPVRVIDAFIDELGLAELGFVRVLPKATGRPAYHPSTLLKIYLYGYLNSVQSSLAAGARSRSQCRDDVADGAIGAGLQDRSPTSEKTPAPRYRQRAPNLLIYAGSLVFLFALSPRSTAQGSRP